MNVPGSLRAGSVCNPMTLSSRYRHLASCHAAASALKCTKAVSILVGVLNLISCVLQKDMGCLTAMIES